MSEPSQVDAQRRRHLLTFLTIGIGFAGGTLIVTFGPGLGIPVKLAPPLGMVFWLIGSYPLWGRGKGGGDKAGKTGE